MNLQTELSSLFNEYNTKYNPSQIKKSIKLDEYLLKNYFKNTEEIFIGIEENENSFNIYRNRKEKTDSVLKSRHTNDERIKQTEKYYKILQFIKSNAKIDTTKAYDITITKVGDNNYQLTFRFCKKSPANFSLHEKKTEVYNILANKFSHRIYLLFLEENISDEETIVKFVSNVSFFVNKILNKKKDISDKNEIEYIEIIEKAYLDISQKVKLLYPAYFEIESNSLSKKIKWSADPHLFFLLFSILIEEKILKITNFGNDNKEIADVLYSFIEVNKKNGEKTEYTKNVFNQYLKSSSELQNNSTDYNQLKASLIELFKSYK